MKKKTVFLLLAACALSLARAQEAPVAVPDIAPAEAAPLLPPQAVPLDTSRVAPVRVPEATPEPAVPEPLPPALAETPPVPTPPPVTAVPPLAPPLPLVAAGRWDGDFSAGFSLSAGSTDSQSFNLGLDTSYQRPDDKLSLSAQYLESRSRSVSNGVVTNSITALQWRLGGRYDRDLTPQDFGFVGLEFSHDRIRQLDLRTLISSGMGRHLLKSRDDNWDAYAGLSYREDYYGDGGVLVNGVLRSRLTMTELLLGEESTHQLGGTPARFKQKFVLYPGLFSEGGTRATLDAGLQLDISKVLSLSMKLQGRYDSLSQAPAEKFDLLFITGLSVKLGS